MSADAAGEVTVAVAMRHGLTDFGGSSTYVLMA